MMTSPLAVLVDFYSAEIANQVVAWVLFQARMREIARRPTWVHGGGVQGEVVFHDPDAIR